MIKFSAVSKSYDGGATFSVKNLDLSVQQGEFLVLLGSSGSGKSTALKLINRLIDPSMGTIAVAGVDIKEQDPVSLRRKIGYVFQEIGLFPHMTIEENVGMVPNLLGWSKDRIKERVGQLLKIINLPPDQFALRLPSQLSGGQQQRVGVARALAADPEYLLMDEPFGALDAVTRDSLQQEMLTLKKQLNKTIVFVTHDLFEALTLADRIGIMQNGELEQLGTPTEILNHPASQFVDDLFARPARQLAAFHALL
ncbi:MAG: glycine/betaine ABC transporter ATP-binding protein [Candidatus Melainabacteria bacterium]|nr:MAG: glycine/betaine ABC transporter ATP-binding protein [Candidatus Melainabacteria bacterium]